MTILQSLAAFYERLDKRGDAPQPSYSVVGVSFAIPINRDGTVERAIDLRSASGTRRIPIDRQLPKVRDHNNSGKDPFLFWDNTGYALGVVRKEMKRGTPEGLFQSFRTVNLEATQGATDPELIAFRAFLNAWMPAHKDKLALKDEDLDLNVVFRSTETGRLVHQSAQAQEIWRRIQDKETQEKQLCLVTGSMHAIARLHPKFPALEAGGSKGPIVSFDKASFTSYGKEQGDNAPVSEEAAFKYGAALNWLLDRDNGRSFRLAETTVVFWADDKSTGGGDVAATDVEETFRSEMTDGDAPVDSAAADTGSEDTDDDDDDDDRDIDAEEAPTMRAQAADVQHQRRAPDPSKLDQATRMHVLGLSPNAGRIAVRFWLVDTWGQLAANIARFKQDIAIEPPDRNPNKKAYALLFETAVQGKAENIPKRLGGELARAILSGGPYPHTLFTAVVGRIRADKKLNAARVGLCKAVIVRNFAREGFPVALDPANTNAAYRLGRLFALIEGAQKAALPGIKSTVKDKYFGAACATPARVFPLLHKNAMNHLAAVRKERGPGLAHWMDKEIGAVWSGLADELPRMLRLEDQGRFIAGYYHQRYTRAANAPEEAQQILASDPEDTNS